MTSGSKFLLYCVLLHYIFFAVFHCIFSMHFQSNRLRLALTKSVYAMRQTQITVLRVFLVCVSLLLFKGVWAEVVMIDDFESYNVGSTWSNLEDTRIIDDCETGDSDNQCLRVIYRPTSIGSARQVRRIEISPSSHYMLSYDVFFESGFQFVKGGKLPGLGPAQPTTGCDDIVSNGWSARLMWRADGRVRNYLYTQDRARPCGDGFESFDPIFVKGQWHKVELFVKVNSGKRTFDGFVVGKVDGKIVTDNRHLRLRDDSTLESLISKFMFSTFFGGADPSWAPTKTVYARFDNFVVQNLENTEPPAARTDHELIVKKPQPPNLQILLVDHARYGTFFREDFDRDLGGYTNRAWKQVNPMSQWATGFTEQRAFIDDAHNRRGHALRVLYPYLQKGSAQTGMRWELNLPETDSLFLSYYVYVPSDFKFGDGGVLPGIGYKAQDDDLSWRANITWSDSGGLNVVSGTSEGYFHDELQHQDKRALLTPGRWHLIGLFVDLKSDSSENGITEVWLDGQKVGFFNRLPFAGISDVSSMNRVYFETYIYSIIDSGAEPFSGQNMWFDDLRVSKTQLDLNESY